MGTCILIRDDVRTFYRLQHIVNLSVTRLLDGTCLFANEDWTHLAHLQVQGPECFCLSFSLNHAKLVPKTFSRDLRTEACTCGLPVKVRSTLTRQGQEAPLLWMP